MAKKVFLTTLAKTHARRSKLVFPLTKFFKKKRKKVTFTKKKFKSYSYLKSSFPDRCSIIESESDWYSMIPPKRRGVDYSSSFISFLVAIVTEATPSKNQSKKWCSPNLLKRKMPKLRNPSKAIERKHSEKHTFLQRKISTEPGFFRRAVEVEVEAVWLDYSAKCLYRYCPITYGFTYDPAASTYGCRHYPMPRMEELHNHPLCTLSHILNTSTK